MSHDDEDVVHASYPCKYNLDTVPHNIFWGISSYADMVIVFIINT